MAGTSPAMTESVIGRPLGACFRLRRDGVRHVALMQTPGPWAPGAIPTVDFLLYRFRAAVKKMGVKSQDRIRRRSGLHQTERLEMHREFAKPPLTDAIIHITSSEA